jgi:hypothetical protein
MRLGLYTPTPLQLPRTAHHACDSFTSTNPITSPIFGICFGALEDMYPQSEIFSILCDAHVASRAHIRALYESSETHASTIRTYSMTFLGFGREKEREGRAQTWVKTVNGLEKRRRRRCVMKNEEDREKDGYLYTLPTHTRSSIPRTHIHATEHVAVCSVFRMFATWRSKHILLNNARLQFSWVLVPSILILSTLHHLLPNSFQITLKDIQYHFFLFETTAQERQRRGDITPISPTFSHLLMGGPWSYLWYNGISFTLWF